MSWGCPEEPTKWCEASVFIQECEFCDDHGLDCLRGDMNDAETCAREEHDISYYADNHGYPGEYDKNVNPEDDDSFPHDVFSGDCKTCKAFQPGAFDAKVDHAQNLKWPGAGLAIAGTILYLVLLVNYMRKSNGGAAVHSGTLEEPK